MSLEARRFEMWFRHERRENKLFDVKFYPGDVSEADREAFFHEVNRLLKLRRDLAFVKKPEMF